MHRHSLMTYHIDVQGRKGYRGSPTNTGSGIVWRIRTPPIILGVPCWPLSSNIFLIDTQIVIDYLDFLRCEQYSKAIKVDCGLRSNLISRTAGINSFGLPAPPAQMQLPQQFLSSSQLPRRLATIILPDVGSCRQRLYFPDHGCT